MLAALRTGWSRSGCSCTRTRPGSCTARTAERRGSYEHTAFTFLGYTFRARKNRTDTGAQFLSFEPAVSKDALKRMGREVRSWHLHTRSDLSFKELARRINPVVAGWVNYYGRFRPWELNPFLMRINAYLVRWIRQKYKRLAAEAEGHREVPGDRPAIPAHVRALATDRGTP